MAFAFTPIDIEIVNIILKNIKIVLKKVFNSYLYGKIGYIENLK